MFDINLPFLKSALTKTYYKISHSIILIVNLSCSESYELFFNVVEKVINEGMLKKFNIIAWTPSSEQIKIQQDFKRDSLFSNTSNISEEISSLNMTPINVIKNSKNKNENFDNPTIKEDKEELNSVSTKNITGQNTINTIPTDKNPNSTNIANNSEFCTCDFDNDNKLTSINEHTDNIHEESPKNLNTINEITKNINESEYNNNIHDNNKKKNSWLSFLNTSKEEINNSKITSLFKKFKIFCKTFKIMIIHINHFSEISTENEIFRNFIGFLLLKKFKTPDTSNMKIKQKSLITKKFSKRNSLQTNHLENIFRSNDDLIEKPRETRVSNYLNEKNHESLTENSFKKNVHNSDKSYFLKDDNLKNTSEKPQTKKFEDNLLYFDSNDIPTYNEETCVFSNTFNKHKNYKSHH